LTANRTWTLSIPNSAELHVAKLINLTTNGVVKTSGGDGTLSSAALTSADVGLGNVTNAAQLTRAANDYQAGIAEKAAPVGADLVLLEDSQAGGAKKWAQVSNLPAGAASKHVIQDEGGAGLTPRTNLNFVGPGIVCTDGGAGPDSTICNVSGGSGGGGGTYVTTFTNVTQVLIPESTHGLGTDLILAIYDATGKRMLAEEYAPDDGNIEINFATAQTGRVVVTGGVTVDLTVAMDLYMHAAMGGL
jgi:hypothetical protein